MLKTIHQAELAYIKEFTESTETDQVIIFSDPTLAGMDHHNFTYIKEGYSPETLKSIIDNEVKRRYENAHTSAFFISDFKIDEKFFQKYPYEIEFLQFIYMATSTTNAMSLKTQMDFHVLKATNDKILEDGIAIDIEANTPYMGDFAKARIQRKAEIYKNKNAKTNLYVGYHKGQAIGNCELFIHDTIAKLEDFDIINAYQRKGFGTHFLKRLLEETEKVGVHQLFLVTDQADTAQEMYKKNHFQVIGYKYEVFIDFNKPK